MKGQFARYLIIGAITFVIDVGLFRLFVGLGIFLAVAATASFATAICAHFTMNKYLNFRAYDRPTHEQASTYAVVAFVCWLVTLAVVEAGVRIGGFSPLESKLAAVAINLPIGFLGHRFLTFGPGIVRTLRRILPHHVEPGT